MLGNRISKLRKEHKLTQLELAKRLGFSRGQLANYEQGQREPDYESLQKIADFFEVTTDFLLGRSATSIKNNDISHTNIDEDEILFRKWAKDSSTGAFFSEILESEEAEIEELREIWEIMKKRRDKN